MLRVRSLVRHAHMGGGAPSQVAFRKAAEKVTIGAGSSSGRIAMRNAVEKSMISRSISETAPRVLSLQRDLLRSVPWIKRAYAVIMPESVRRLPSAIDVQPNPPRPALPQLVLSSCPIGLGAFCLTLTPITLSRTPTAHPPHPFPIMWDLQSSPRSHLHLIHLTARPTGARRCASTFPRRSATRRT